MRGWAILCSLLLGCGASAVAPDAAAELFDGDGDADADADGEGLYVDAGRDADNDCDADGDVDVVDSTVDTRIAEVEWRARVYNNPGDADGHEIEPGVSTLIVWPDGSAVFALRAFDPVLSVELELAVELEVYEAGRLVAVRGAPGPLGGRLRLVGVEGSEHGCEATGDAAASGYVVIPESGLVEFEFQFADCQTQLAEGRIRLPSGR